MEALVSPFLLLIPSDLGMLKLLPIRAAPWVLAGPHNAVHKYVNGVYLYSSSIKPLESTICF